MGKFTKHLCGESLTFQDLLKVGRSLEVWAQLIVAGVFIWYLPDLVKMVPEAISLVRETF